MSSISEKYLQQLGDQLAETLGDDYRFYKSRLEFRGKSGEGDNVIVLSAATKYSPYISLAFYFGRNYSEAKRIEKLVGNKPFYYHIQQYSLNVSRMKGLGYSGQHTWQLDIREPIQTALVSDILMAIRGAAIPFFERFSTIQAARKAIALDDPWCFGGRAFWRQLLFIDAAMNDLNHFKTWAAELNEFQGKQANDEIARIEQALSNAA